MTSRTRASSQRALPLLESMVGSAPASMRKRTRCGSSSAYNNGGPPCVAAIELTSALLLIRRGTSVGGRSYAAIARLNECVTSALKSSSSSSMSKAEISSASSNGSFMSGSIWRGKYSLICGTGWLTSARASSNSRATATWRFSIDLPRSEFSCATERSGGVAVVAVGAVAVVAGVE